MNEIIEFCEKMGITESEYYGETPIIKKRTMHLCGITHIPDGFAACIGGNLVLYDVTSVGDNFKPVLSGDLIFDKLSSIGENFAPTCATLSLRGLKYVQDGFNPTVYVDLVMPSLLKLPDEYNPTIPGSLRLTSLKELPKSFTPCVGEKLELCSITELNEGFNPIVGSVLHLDGITSVPKGFQPTVGHSVYMRNVVDVPEDFNMVVHGELVLSSLRKTPKNFKPIVGGTLYLHSVCELGEGFDPIVGDGMYLGNVDSIYDIILSRTARVESEYGSYNYITGTDTPTIFDEDYNNFDTDSPCKISISGYRVVTSWLNGKYMSIDNIFSEVIHRKGNVMKVKSFRDYKELYVVTNGNGVYAHGVSLSDAQRDLEYKLSTTRDVEEYKSWTLDTIVNVADAIKCYRTITGACEYGTKYFVDTVLGDNVKDTYTIQEIIHLSENRFGNKGFSNFFIKKQ